MEIFSHSSDKAFKLYANKSLGNAMGGREIHFEGIPNLFGMRKRHETPNI